jgi:hypothetical protein
VCVFSAGVFQKWKPISHSDFLRTTLLHNMSQQPLDPVSNFLLLGVFNFATPGNVKWTLYSLSDVERKLNQDTDRQGNKMLQYSHLCAADTAIMVPIILGDG